jgi:ATP-dependent DNA ligase
MASEPFPSMVQPILPTLVKLPFSDPDWLFEPKWDGSRDLLSRRRQRPIRFNDTSKGDHTFRSTLEQSHNTNSKQGKDCAADLRIRSQRLETFGMIR